MTADQAAPEAQRDGEPIITDDGMTGAQIAAHLLADHFGASTDDLNRFLADAEDDDDTPEAIALAIWRNI